VSELWICSGRRSGKSRAAALLSVFVACFRDHSRFLVSGETGVVALVAADRAQAQICFRYLKSFLRETPLLASLVESETQDVIRLKNHVEVEVVTASAVSPRGRTIISCIADEVGFWNTGDGAANSDSEVLDAIRPAMLTIPHPMLIAISSP